MAKGLFIAIEGPDGCGKSTQIALLKEFLEKQGCDVLLTREPGGTALGEEIRKLLLVGKERKVSPYCELLLFEAARAQHVMEVLEPALNSGKIIIASRYADATRAYQGGGRGLPLEEVRKANELGTRGLWPDLTIILDIDSEEGLRRVKSCGKDALGKDLPPGELDRIEAESLDFHRRVREEYLKLAREEKERCKVVDGSQSREEVAREISALVLEKIKNNA
ncbi:dTMP kinase [bacterium]|nr:dTMP kinase [bacterium]